MADAELHCEVERLRSRSMDERINFKLAELRVVLLGSNGSQRCLVGNLLMKKYVKQPQVCLETKGKTLTVIYTPDLWFHSDLTEDRLTELVKAVAKASSPGPHVFLLALQPEIFTERHLQRLRHILEKFSENPFDHVIVLLSTNQQENRCFQQVFVEKPHLKSVIEECRYRYLWIRHSDNEELNHFSRAELLTRLVQMVKENSEDYLKYKDKNLDPKPQEFSTTSSSAQKVKRQSSFLKKLPEECDYQVLLLRVEDKKKSKPKLISGKTSQQELESLDIVEWRGKKVKYVKSVDLFTLSVPDVIKELKTCLSRFYFGPNVLLLKLSAFTEENIESLRFILSLFGPDVFKHSILVFSDKHDMEPNSLLQECGGRHLKSTADTEELMMEVKAVVELNKGSFVSLTDVFLSKMKMEKMHLVFSGTRIKETQISIIAILGATKGISQSKVSQCMKREAEVCGRTVSIVELPALSGKAEREVLQECLTCVSMCEPEGVHAFVMVLPLDSLTDEDKAEFKTIQSMFSTKMNNLTVILFTVESPPKAEAFTDFVKKHEDIRDLCQSCRGHFFLNINNPQQVPEMLQEIENYRNSYTTKAFAEIQFAKFTETTASEASLLRCGTESEENLRIVLIGKSGSGKSSSGNTILGEERFKCGWGQKATTICCQKTHSIVNGCRVDVVDTPGLFDRSMSNSEINEEMIKCISLLAPGPHVFLLVLKIGRFTPEEKDTVELIKKGFGADALKYTIVLFTHGEILDRYKTSVEEFIKDKDSCDVLCQKLISDCGNRVHVFNNNDSKRQQQALDLIQKIDALVKENGGSCYTNEMLEKAEAAIQKEMQRLMEENERFRREKQEMEEKHKEEMLEMQQRMDKEHEEMERVRKEKNNELKEMDEKIAELRQLRREEQEIRYQEEQIWIDQDKVKRQQYMQKLKELEENLHSFDLNARESRYKMEQEREEWEEERRQWWQKRQNEEVQRQNDELVRLEKLQQEYKDKLETFRKEKEKEDQHRFAEEERKRNELEEKHRKQITDLRKSYEEEARKKAEEYNEFRERKENDFSALIEKHLAEVQCLKGEIEQTQGEYQCLQNRAAHNENTLKSEMEDIKTEMENLQTRHKQQLIELAVGALTKEKEICRIIKDVQKKHSSEVEKCKKGVKHEYESERRRTVEHLKKRQNREMKDLERKTNKDDLPQQKRQLSDVHKREIAGLQSELWNQRKQKLKEELDKIKGQHEEELSRKTQDVFRKNKEYWAKEKTELEKDQKEEMEKFMKKAKGKVNEVELDRLKTKHQIEMDEIKDKMVLEEGKCLIM